MPRPGDYQAAFSRLLSQLADEHEKQIAALQNELEDLRQSSDVNALQGRERLPVEVSSKSGPSGKMKGAEGVVPPAPQSPPPMMQERSEINIEPEKLDETFKGEEEAILGGTTPAAPTRYDSSERKTSVVNNDNFTAMHWSLDETRLPEEEDAREFANKLSRYSVARVMGLNKERLLAWIYWWFTLKEPERPRTLIYQFTESRRFQTLCLVVIFVNTLHILWGTDDDIRSVIENPKSFQEAESIDWRFWVDVSFCTFYTFELTLKICIHGFFFFIGSGCGWNFFDAILVLFSIFDIIITVILADEAKGRPNLTFLRALRILRMARVMRMVRAVKWIQDLRLMLDCVLNSAFHLFWCIVLIILVLIIFSLLLIQGMTNHMGQLVDDPVRFAQEASIIRGTFDSVPNAMLALFEATTGGDDWSNLYHIIGRSGTFFNFVFLFYIAFFAIVAWNIVMSTFVEKALKLATPDIDTMIMEKRRKDLHYAKELTSILEASLDEDHDGVITIEEFRRHMSDAEVKKFFQARDLDMKDAELFFHMLASVHDPDGQSGQVDIRTFVLGCMRLRGVASNIDVQSLHYDLKNMFRSERNAVLRLIESIEDRNALPQPEDPRNALESSPGSLPTVNMATLRSGSIEIVV